MAMPSNGEEEVVPLTAEIESPKSRQQAAQPRSRGVSRLLREWRWSITALLALVIVCLYASSKEEQQFMAEDVENKDEDDIPRGNPIPLPAPLVDPAPIATAPEPPRPVPSSTTPVDSFTAAGNPPFPPPVPFASSGNVETDLQHMSDQFDRARTDLFDKLRLDYGSEAFDDIFFTDWNGQHVSVGRLALVSPSDTTISWERVKRKLQIKLLGVLNHVPARFVWATGGHSSAAGHGNLFNQSYTSALERDLHDVYAAVGIDFVGRNYAMGGTSSSPEVAMCVDSIFGTDIDVLSWDFGMTDGNNFVALAHYFYHAGYNPGRPVCVALQVDGKHGHSRIESMRGLEDRGLATLYLKAAVYDHVISKIPLSSGKTDTELDAMGDYVRNFKCADKTVEAGEPYCASEKWLLTICPERKHKNSWHPGYKWHALVGHIVSLTLMEVLYDALRDLKARGSFAPAALLDELRAQEDADYARFQSSPLLDIAQDFLIDKEEKMEIGDVDLSVLFHRPALCHTGIRPAEIRYSGILTESSQVGLSSFDRGIGRQEANRIENDSDRMRLVFEEADIQQCSVPILIDFKDFFYLHHREGWKSMILPNDAEVQAYPSTAKSLKGVIMVCIGGCSWGKCAPDDIRETAFVDGGVEMEVNGERVTTIKLHDRCFLIGHEGGMHWQPDGNGKFGIRARVTTDDSYVRFSSFILV